MLAENFFTKIQKNKFAEKLSRQKIAIKILHKISSRKFRRKNSAKHWHCDCSFFLRKVATSDSLRFAIQILIPFPRFSDNQSVKKFSKIILAFSLLAIFGALPCFSYMVKYKEDFYRLYHIHYQQFPDDCMENIYWLEQAVRADFVNPLYAMAKIENEEQWEKYRNLFQMHLNLKLIEQHQRLARVYDKRAICFYDAPWRDEYLANLDKAKSCYEAGLYYWREARLWAEKANETKFRWLHLTDLQYWEDERERIASAELDYEKILRRELARVDAEIAKLKTMEKKY